MSAIGELEAALAQILGLVDTAREHIGTADDCWNDGGRGYRVMIGTRDPEAQVVLDRYEWVHAELIRAWQLVSRCREFIDNYRLALEVNTAFGAAPPNIPHPSTFPRVFDSADRAWAESVRSRLPERAGRRSQTTGAVFDGDGTELRLISGWDNESEQARLSLHNSGVFQAADERGAPSVVTHVETKYAQRMRSTGQTLGTVVLNNQMCQGAHNCATAVAAILPVGSTLTVWQPGDQEPTIIRGQARW